MKKIFKLLNIFVLLIAFIFPAVSGYALDQIVKPYQSIRSSGMGGVKITTGLYDENFFGNPARVIANPRLRVTILDPMFEWNSNLISNVKTFTSSNTSGDKSGVYSNLGSVVGKNAHLRYQSTMPSVYLPAGPEGKMAWGIGMLVSAQGDIDFRRNFTAVPQAIVDAGPALTVGRKFLDNNELHVGLTTHMTYRLTSPNSISFVDLIKGKSISPVQELGGGTHIEFDIGSTYLLPVSYWGFDFTAGLAINNILGGNYSNFKFDPANRSIKPARQPRSLGFGVSGLCPEWKELKDTLIAIEWQDIGNNPDGGMFRLFHFGVESHYGILVPRLGINQGYFSVGLGIAFRYFTFDLTTYGEELSLNPGQHQDRRFAARLGFQVEI